MAEIKVDASKLKSEGAAVTSQLISFLKEKTSAEVSNEGGKINVKTPEVGVNKKYIRVLLKKFLHQNDLKATYRVIGGDENALLINERKIYEEKD
ncbi:MAG: 60S ribosomal protein L22 [Candidatus Bathyarchaeota archaeon]|nr:60S ribosomal protein L22 [Candidatus Bathyarchaeota archaeon]